MTELIEQLCSPDLAKKLKELGAKQESSFYWDEMLDPFKPRIIPLITEHDKAIFKIVSSDPLPPHFYSAFTVDELGQLLPAKVHNIHLSCVKLTGVWEIAYGFKTMIGDKSEVNARAKMLINLIENDFYELK